MMNSTEIRDALQVLVLDKKISEWLERNDPMALNQARKALGTISITLKLENIK